MCEGVYIMKRIVERVIQEQRVLRNLADVELFKKEITDNANTDEITENAIMDEITDTSSIPIDDFNNRLGEAINVKPLDERTITIQSIQNFIKSGLTVLSSYFCTSTDVGACIPNDKYVVILIVGHGGLTGTTPKTFKSSATYKIKYLAPFGNSAILNSIQDVNAIKELQTYRLTDPDNFIKEMDDLYERINSTIYIQKQIIRSKHRKSTEIDLDRITDLYSNVVLNKRFVLKENISMKKGETIDQATNRIIETEKNFGVYIFQNNLGIPIGTKVQANSYMAYPHTTMEEINTMFTMQFNLKTLYVIDSTCNPVINIVDSRMNRIEARDYQTFMQGLNDKYKRDSASGRKPRKSRKPRKPRKPRKLKTKKIKQKKLPYNI